MLTILSLSHLVFGILFRVFSCQTSLFFSISFTVIVCQPIGKVSSQIRMEAMTRKDGRRGKAEKRGGWAADTFTSWASRA